jgi:hypothetical protein
MYMACRLVLIRDNHHCQSQPRSDRPLSGQMMGVSGNPPPVNRVDLSATMQSQLAAMDEI